MQVQWHESWIGLRPSKTRIPFRYGRACLERCPQLLVRVTVEVDGRRADGFAGDCLPPGWFDKTPGKDYARQLDEMLATIEAAREEYAGALHQPTAFFPVWLELQQQIESWCSQREVVPLLASFGLSLWERAILDAACRAHHVGFARAARDNLFGIDAGRPHKALQGAVPADWLPKEPRKRIAVRHTVGMGDALRPRDISDEERLDDGRPQALQEYIRQLSIRFFKIKLSGDPAADLKRLLEVTSVIEEDLPSEYRVTLDGNEQFDDWETLGELLIQLSREPRLTKLWNHTLAIEQPLPRSRALDTSLESLLGLLGGKPVIIDESDGTLDAYARAIELGYGGVSSKNCKGAMRAILNAGLAWHTSRSDPYHSQIITGEDLCSVGVIPVQADLCLAATLGLDHVERNGHHFHPGLTYLPPHSREEAIEAHPDFYTRIEGVVSPHVQDGDFLIESFHSEGFGFRWRPHESDWRSPESIDWTSFLAETQS